MGRPGAWWEPAPGPQGGCIAGRGERALWGLLNAGANPIHAGPPRVLTSNTLGARISQMNSRGTQMFSLIVEDPVANHHVRL